MAWYQGSSLYMNILATVGVFSSIAFLIDTTRSILHFGRCLLSPYLTALEENQKLALKYGDWALITGSTDGIGKAYAKELARRNINLILVSRNEEKLQATAKEIELECPIKTKIIAVDFSTGSQAIEIVKNHLKDCPPIGILVNNVGKMYDYPMYLSEVSEKDLWDILNINIGATTMMTRIIINQMKERGRGAIVNVSSGAELQPMPLMNVYAASKVYVKHFTAALREEYSNCGITIQNISPYFVNTKMNHFSNKLQETSLFVPDVANFAKYAVSTLGKVDHSTGYWSHDLQYLVISLVPMWLRMMVAKKMTLHLRQDYLNQHFQSEK